MISRRTALTDFTLGRNTSPVFLNRDNTAYTVLIYALKPLPYVLKGRSCIAPHVTMANFTRFVTLSRYKQTRPTRKVSNEAPIAHLPTPKDPRASQTLLLRSLRRDRSACKTRFPLGSMNNTPLSFNGTEQHPSLHAHPASLHS